MFCRFSLHEPPEAGPLGEEVCGWAETPDKGRPEAEPLPPDVVAAEARGAAVVPTCVWRVALELVGLALADFGWGLSALSHPSPEFWDQVPSGFRLYTVSPLPA
jgi:hypothetical protein